MTGPPLPLPMPTGAGLRSWVDDPLQPQHVATAATVMGWLLWAAITAAILASLGLRLRRIPTVLARIPDHLPGPARTLTATVLGAAAVTATAAPAAAGNPPAATDTTPADTTPAAGAPNLAAPGAAQSSTGAPRATDHQRTAVDKPPARARTHRVRAGDTLSGIAAHHLHDADRWPTIFALNRGTPFPRIGGTLTDPDVIYPGWTLKLPDTADSRPEQQPAIPHLEPPDTHSPGDRPDLPPGNPAPRPPSSPPAAATAAPSTAPSASSDDGVIEEPAAGTTDPAATTTPAAGSAKTTTDPAGDTTDAGTRQPRRLPRGVSLPGGSWIELSLALAIVAAATLVWLHRRRRYIPRPFTAQHRLDDPDLAPMPPIVQQLQHRLRRHPTDKHPDARTTNPAANALPPSRRGVADHCPTTRTKVKSAKDSQAQTPTTASSEAPGRVPSTPPRHPGRAAAPCP